MNKQTGSSRRSILTAGAVSTLLLLASACGRDGDTGAESPIGDSIPPVLDSIPPVGDSIPPITNVDLPVDAPVTGDPLVEADTVVFGWTETGGCAMGGPNCARYEITADGAVSTYREGADPASEPAASGQIDVALVDAWQAAVAAEDFEALRGRLGAGEMTAAFDGTDYVLDVPLLDVELSSVEVEFDASEPVFRAAADLVQAASVAAPLDFEMR